MVAFCNATRLFKKLVIGHKILYIAFRWILLIMNYLVHLCPYQCFTHLTCCLLRCPLNAVQWLWGCAFVLVPPPPPLKYSWHTQGYICCRCATWGLGNAVWGCARHKCGSPLSLFRFQIGLWCAFLVGYPFYQRNVWRLSVFLSFCFRYTCGFCLFNPPTHAL